MRGTEVQFDTIFAPSFLAQVSGAQLRGIAAQLASLGTFEIAKVTRPAPDAGVAGSALIQLTSNKGYAMPITLVVDQAAPNRRASLFVARVDGSTLVSIVAEDTARAMAIGSAFGCTCSRSGGAK